MAGILIRGGFLIIVGTVVYLALTEFVLEGADISYVPKLLSVGGIGIASGIVLKILGRVTAGIVARTCPRCRRLVAHGRTYCDDHRVAAINEQRDRERRRGE